MKRHLNERYEQNAVCINITKLKEDYPSLLANDVRDALIEEGATIDGKKTDGYTYMLISNVPYRTIVNVFEAVFNVDNIDDYFCQNCQKQAVDRMPVRRPNDFRQRNLNDFPAYDDVDIDDYVDESESRRYSRHMNEGKKTYKTYDDAKLQECIDKIKEAEELDEDIQGGNDKACFRKLRKVKECCSKLESYASRKLKECNAKNLKECCRRLKECCEKLNECNESLDDCRKELNEDTCKSCNKTIRECVSKIKECCEKIDRCNRRLKECNEHRHSDVRNFKAVFEKRKGCCPKHRSLYEALKAYDKKDQEKLNAIEKNIKSASKFKPTEDEAKAAFAKLKKEFAALSKIKKDETKKFSLADVKGIKSVLSKIEKSAPSEAKSIKKFLEKVDAALNEGKKTLNDNTKINGKSMNSCTNKELKECLLKLKKIVSSLNESKADKEKIDTFKKCIRRIEEELTYRAIYGKLFEDESLSDDELAKMFGAPQGEETPDDSKEEKDDDKDEKDEKDSKDEKDEEDEDVPLSRIEIRMKDKKAAEDLKQACLDADIPEEAIEIVPVNEDGEEEEEEDEKEDSDAEGNEDENGEEEEEKETPNESVRYKNLARLFEGEEGGDDEGAEDETADDSEEGDNEDGKSEDAEDGDEEETENDGKQYVFKLIDTDYTDELQQILADQYDIKKEEFEEKIGGQIVKDDEDSDDEDSDDDSKKDDEDSKDKDDTDDVDPDELFKGL